MDTPHDDVVLIIDNGEQQSVDVASATALESIGILYWCDEPDCTPNSYHIDADHTWDDVEKALSEV